MAFKRVAVNRNCEVVSPTGQASSNDAELVAGSRQERNRFSQDHRQDHAADGIAWCAWSYRRERKKPIGLDKGGQTRLWCSLDRIGDGTQSEPARRSLRVTTLARDLCRVSQIGGRELADLGTS